MLIIEDLTTTGESVKKVIESVKSAQGVVSAVGVMVNRNPQEVTQDFIGEVFFALGELPMKTYTEDLCVFCKKGVPINTRIGHGRKFVKDMR